MTKIYNNNGNPVRRFAVKIASKLGLYKLGVNLDTKIQERKMSKVFSRYGLETLIKADNAMRKSNLKMFLVFGTLLGAYRDK